MFDDTSKNKLKLYAVLVLLWCRSPPMYSLELNPQPRVLCTVFEATGIIQYNTLLLWYFCTFFTLLFTSVHWKKHLGWHEYMLKKKCFCLNTEWVKLRNQFLPSNGWNNYFFLWYLHISQSSRATVLQSLALTHLPGRF